MSSKEKKVAGAQTLQPPQIGTESSSWILGSESFLPANGRFSLRLFSPRNPLTDLCCYQD